MDIHKQKLIFEVGSGEIEEEGSEGEVDAGLVLLVEVVDELTVVFDFPAGLVVSGLVLFIRFQDFVADEFGFGH